MFNYSLDELKGRNILDILKRVQEINDLSYIDIILKNVGMDISFLSNREFLSKGVEIKSKLSFLYQDKKDEDSEEAFSEYLSDFDTDEDSIIDKLNDLLGGEDQSLDIDDYPITEDRDRFSTSSILETHKDTLSALFGGLKTMDSSKQKSEEEKKDGIEESINKDKEEKSSVLDREEKLDIFEDSDEDSLMDEETDLEIRSKNKQNIDEDIDTMQSNDDIEDSDLEGFLDIQSKDITMFLDNDSFDYEDEDSEIDSDNISKENSHLINMSTRSIEDRNNDSDNSDIEDDEISYSNSMNGFEDNTGDELQQDLDEEVDNNYFERMGYEEQQERDNLIQEATNHFLNSGKQAKLQRIEEYNELRRKAKSKEKLVDSDRVTDLDDALAKTILSVGLGILSLPEITSELLRKRDKNRGNRNLEKKRSFMIVEDDEEDESDDGIW